jgi:hypothetical protein
MANGKEVKVKEWKDTKGLTQLRSHCQKTLGKVLFRLSQLHGETPAVAIAAVLRAQGVEAALEIRFKVEEGHSARASRVVGQSGGARGGGRSRRRLA